MVGSTCLSTPGALVKGLDVYERTSRNKRMWNSAPSRINEILGKGYIEVLLFEAQ